MRIENERIKTFIKWPVSFLPGKVLAASGFYYLGRGDEVRCAFCRVELMKWERGVDPAKLHRQVAPQCSFASKALHKPPVYPQYATDAARLKSFKNWPHSLKQDPKALAEAGFFYIGEEDKTKCFYCDGGLKDWEKGDIPWKEHARWFDRCAYVTLVKGREYVASAALGNGKQTPPPSPISVDKERFCKVCYDEEANVCFTPCGHVVACAKCAILATKCPMCRNQILEIVRLYYS